MDLVSLSEVDLGDDRFTVCLDRLKASNSKGLGGQIQSLTGEQAAAIMQQLQRALTELGNDAANKRYVTGYQAASRQGATPVSCPNAAQGFCCAARNDESARGQYLCFQNNR